MGAYNFAAVARRLVGAEGEPPVRRAAEGRQVRVGAYPISIDVREFETIARAPRRRHAGCGTPRRRLGAPQKVLIGVDRLDYTKGIDVRLEAFRELLRRPGRDGLGRARLRRPRLRDGAGRRAEPRGRRCLRPGARARRAVGGRDQRRLRHRRAGRPCTTSTAACPLEALVVLYRGRRRLMVTPLRDGMNLVAKEFAACRVDDNGVLVLSEFAGAADELTEAILVNSHDQGAVVAALAEAVDLDPRDARRRMQAIRAVVRANDVDRWAHDFLADLARPVRRR